MSYILLKQVGGEAVTQRVRTDALADAGDFGCFLDRAMQLPRRDRRRAAAPETASHREASPRAARLRATTGAAVRAGPARASRCGPSSLALFDADQHAFAIDVVDLQVRHLGHAQARAIGDTERGLVLDAWWR